MSFAEALTRMVASKQRESQEHVRLAERWQAKEAELVDALVASFKNRCLREAEQLRNNATISFAVLCREVEQVPRHCINDSVYLVKDWGDCSAECWFYARHGPGSTWMPGTPVLYAELLESMLPKFLERLTRLGFETCERESGTWKVTVTWQLPDQAHDGHSSHSSALEPPRHNTVANGKVENGAATGKAVDVLVVNETPTPVMNAASNAARQGDSVTGAAAKSLSAPTGKRPRSRSRSPTPTPTEGAPSEARTAAPSEPTELAGDDNAASDGGV